MGSVSSANFAFILNHSPTVFFNATRGLRQGCRISPLLFILDIGGLSRLIQQAKVEGKINGIKFSHNHFITLLFLDDVLIFGIGDEQEWLHYKFILDTLCYASGMMISYPKSGMYSLNPAGENLQRLRVIYPLDI